MKLLFNQGLIPGIVEATERMKTQSVMDAALLTMAHERFGGDYRLQTETGPDSKIT